MVNDWCLLYVSNDDGLFLARLVKETKNVKVSEIGRAMECSLIGGFRIRGNIYLGTKKPSSLKIKDYVPLEVRKLVECTGDDSIYKNIEDTIFKTGSAKVYITQYNDIHIEGGVY